MLEYIVILAAVITAVIAFAGGGFRQTVREQILDNAVDELGVAVNTINLSSN
jgi:hypothetical protein